MSRISPTAFAPRTSAAFAVLIAATILLVPAVSRAQQGPGGRNALSEEQRMKAWKAEVKSVAQDIGLDGDNAQKLESLYIDTRNEYMKEATAKLQNAERDSSKMMRAVNEVQKAAQKKFLDKASAFLNEKQTARVKETLGAYDLTWDGYMTALLDLGLPDDVHKQAGSKLLTYVATFAPIREQAYESGDLSLILQSLDPMKKNLDSDLQKILSGEKYADWLKTTEFKGGRR